MIGLIILGLIYLILVSLFPIIWKILSDIQPQRDEIKGLSVVIPYRNEVHNLPKLLHAIVNLKVVFPIEFIFVNDHSDDNSYHLINDFFTQQHPTLAFKNSSLNKEEEGKKKALSLGVNQAQYDWIWQLDADVYFGVDVLRPLYECFNAQAQLFIAPVLIDTSVKTYQKHFEQSENMLLQWITAVACLFKAPFLANGANLFYPKKLFQNYSAAGIGKNYPGGDDIFLLHYVKKHYGVKCIKSIHYSSAAVFTSGASNKTQFWQQKIRWASKMNDAQLPTPLFFSLVLVGIALLPIYALALVFLGIVSFKLFVAFMVIKFMAEIFGALIIKNHYRSSNPILYFPLFCLIFPYYSFITFFKAKNQNFSWKNRNFSKS